MNELVRLQVKNSLGEWEDVGFSDLSVALPTSDIDSNFDITYHYDSDGKIDYMEKTVSGTTFRKTFTWTNGQLTQKTKWMAQ